MSSATLRIGRTERRPHGIAGLALHDDAGRRICELATFNTTCLHLSETETQSPSILLLSAAVYALDKSVPEECSRRLMDKGIRADVASLRRRDVEMGSVIVHPLLGVLDPGDPWDLDFATQATPVLRGIAQRDADASCH